jgi:HD-GYP domain-containing protein (c-di-GMP phosphodiesterase class II)
LREPLGARREITKRLRLSPVDVDHAFVAGLLHDVGKLMLVSNYP